MATKADGWTSGIPEDKAETGKVEAEVKEAEGETEVEGESQETEDEPEGEVTVSIDGDAPPEEDDEITPQWVKDTRKANRELIRRNRELEEQVANQTQQPKAIELGAKPTLESCEYDETKFVTEVEAWTARKAEIARIEAKKAEETNKVETEWKSQLDTYVAAKKVLQVKDFDDAEGVVKDTLSVVQQGIIVRVASKPALVVYALGKNPKKAKELASITDPIKFAFAVANLEKDLKVTKKAPAPERKVATGSAPLSGKVDPQLERLRADAAKTGNYSKVSEYKRQLKARGK